MVGEGQEVILYRETLFRETIHGKRKSMDFLRGKYELPYFSQRFNESTGQPIPGQAAVDRTETVYEFPYSPEKIKEILALDQAGHRPTLMLQDYEHKMTMRNLHDFTHDNFYELIDKLKKGQTY